jgi:hypothetical protein
MIQNVPETDAGIWRINTMAPNNKNRLYQYVFDKERVMN